MCSVFSGWKLSPPYLIITAAEGWGEEEICTKGVGGQQKERKEMGWGDWNSDISPPATYVVHSNSKSYMTDRNNDRQLVSIDGKKILYFLLENNESVKSISSDLV